MFQVTQINYSNCHKFFQNELMYVKNWKYI